MKPEPVPTTDQVNLLRQQVILSQVRIMELEDGRDEITPRLAELEELLRTAQTLADQQSDEAAHLEKVRADLQAQYEHMRHMQHVTHSALEESRIQLAAAEQVIATSSQTQADLLMQIGHAHEQLAGRDHLLQQALAESAQTRRRLEQLDAERRKMKASRSWRWTAWLRALERAFSRRAP